MDRNTLTGLLLILLTMIAWAYFTMPSQEELERRQAEQARQDSIAQAEAQADTQPQQDIPQETQETGVTENQQQEEQQLIGNEEDTPRNMGIFSDASISDTSRVAIETPLYRATFTNVGAGPVQIVLKDRQTWNDQPVKIIKDTTRSAYAVEFLSNENLDVSTDRLVFEQLTPDSSITLSEGESAQLAYALNVSDEKRIIYTYTFNSDNHVIDLDITFQGLNQEIIGGLFDFGWKSPLRFTERDPTQESYYTSAYVYTGGEMEQLYLDEAGRDEQSYSGDIDWVASRTKFFTQIIKSETETDGAVLIGEVSGPIDDRDTQYRYQSYITSNIPADSTAQFELYIGALEYYGALNEFDETAYDMVDVGYAWTRWFADPLVRFIILPFFDFVEPYMNMGLAIILFAVLIKLILYPLTKKSYRSMAAMKELQPKMKEIQEKYEDDPQKQQKATMKLYKEEGVNPLGGCLPNLLQLPILITLWRFFQNSILIRQEEFLWATDLSAPDYILGLPFEIPFIGDQLAGFVLLMSVAMIFQSKLTGGMSSGGGAPGGMNMKAMMYIFPVMMLFIFNNFAAGLSLYYLIYNVVSILQQLIIYRQMDKEKELAEAS